MPIWDYQNLQKLKELGKNPATTPDFVYCIYLPAIAFIGCYKTVTMKGLCATDINSCN